MALAPPYLVSVYSGCGSERCLSGKTQALSLLGLITSLRRDENKRKMRMHERTVHVHIYMHMYTHMHYTHMYTETCVHYEHTHAYPPIYGMSAGSTRIAYRYTGIHVRTGTLVGKNTHAHMYAYPCVTCMH